MLPSEILSLGWRCHHMYPSWRLQQAKWKNNNTNFEFFCCLIRSWIALEWMIERHNVTLAKKSCINCIKYFLRAKLEKNIACVNTLINVTLINIIIYNWFNIIDKYIVYSYIIIHIFKYVILKLHYEIIFLFHF